MRFEAGRTAVLIALLVAIALPFTAEAQSRSDREKAAAQSQLAIAEAALASAEVAGAPTLANDVYEEAARRLAVARADWNSNDRDQRRIANLRAIEAAAAAEAAEAQALLVSANREARSLITDIATFGGPQTSLQLYDPPAITSRGATSLDRVIVAENAVAVARKAGANNIAAADLERAEEVLKTARMLAGHRRQDESADHLAFATEMMARRAEYLARRNLIMPRLPEMRTERTRFAQVAADTRAQEEQARRLEAERQAAELRQRLQAESLNRQMEQAELDRLRQQLNATENELRMRLQADREARTAEERALDDAIARYQAALSRGASSLEIERLRRDVEDRRLALRSVQDRERLSEAARENEIRALESALSRERSEGRLTADVLAQRERELRAQRDELARLQREREEGERLRAEAEAARMAAIAEAEQRRSEAETQAEALRQQIAQERSRAAETEAELARAREELSRRDAANAERIAAMQRELATMAETRTTERGFIITLPGLFFDSGQSALKAGARTALSRIADQLKVNDQLTIAIEGHTDSVGSEELNQALSERRATAVRDYLVSRGIPAARMTVTGLGKNSPVATNDTPAGRQQNRRVELVISQ
jgi:outer membrane protein OmpA-like peptidoglycan-associated protein